MTDLSTSIEKMRSLAKIWSETGSVYQQELGAHLTAVCDAAEAPPALTSLEPHSMFETDPAPVTFVTLPAEPPEIVAQEEAAPESQDQPADSVPTVEPVIGEGEQP